MSNNTPLQLSECKTCKIDLKVPQKELISEIKQILQETQSHKASVMCEDFWNWQYVHTPGNHSCVYVTKMNDRIVGYYHVPIYEGKIAGQNALIAMIQDVAISPTVRGKGIFTQLATFANQDIDAQPIAACYTFPNHKSIHTFLKYNNYTIIDVLKTYLILVDAKVLLRKKVKIPLLSGIMGYPVNLLFRLPRVQDKDGIAEIDEFDASVEKLYHTYLQRYSNYVLRDKRYLTWRYKNRPHSTYFTIGYYEALNLTAVATFKIDIMFEVPTLLLMDYAFTNPNHFFELIKYAPLQGTKYTSDKIGIIFTAMCDKHFTTMRKPFFLSVPQRLNPRKLHLLTRPVCSNSPTIQDSHQWFVTLGDWDVF
ncbi:MAG: GNAT family N-acetyltransferase [Bacteroidia bacterium]|nr:GNAT family N-acetyltransferase [Bacteroidia bacterium]MDW8347121.1 GNAT family N-acetyltransferase [Bacteroidia bacterium]